MLPPCRDVARAVALKKDVARISPAKRLRFGHEVPSLQIILQGTYSLVVLQGARHPPLSAGTRSVAVDIQPSPTVDSVSETFGEGGPRYARWKRDIRCKLHKKAPLQAEGELAPVRVSEGFDIQKQPPTSTLRSAQNFTFRLTPK